MRVPWNIVVRATLLCGASVVLAVHVAHAQSSTQPSPLATSSPSGSCTARPRVAFHLRPRPVYASVGRQYPGGTDLDVLGTALMRRDEQAAADSEHEGSARCPQCGRSQGWMVRRRAGLLGATYAAVGAVGGVFLAIPTGIAAGVTIGVGAAAGVVISVFQVLREGRSEPDPRARSESDFRVWADQCAERRVDPSSEWYREVWGTPSKNLLVRTLPTRGDLALSPSSTPPALPPWRP